MNATVDTIILLMLMLVAANYISFISKTPHTRENQGRNIEHSIALQNPANDMMSLDGELNKISTLPRVRKGFIFRI